jgi:hypothetical protein
MLLVTKSAPIFHLELGCASRINLNSHNLNYDEPLPNGLSTRQFRSLYSSFREARNVQSSGSVAIRRILLRTKQKLGTKWNLEHSTLLGFVVRRRLQKVFFTTLGMGKILKNCDGCVSAQSRICTNSEVDTKVSLGYNLQVGGDSLFISLTSAVIWTLMSFAMYSGMSAITNDVTADEGPLLEESYYRTVVHCKCGESIGCHES